MMNGIHLTYQFAVEAPQLMVLKHLGIAMFDVAMERNPSNAYVDGCFAVWIC